MPLHCKDAAFPAAVTVKKVSALRTEEPHILAMHDRQLAHEMRAIRAAHFYFEPLGFTMLATVQKRRLPFGQHKSFEIMLLLVAFWSKKLRNYT